MTTIKIIIVSVIATVLPTLQAMVRTFRLGMKRSLCYHSSNRFTTHLPSTDNVKTHLVDLLTVALYPNDWLVLIAQPSSSVSKVVCHPIWTYHQVHDDNDGGDDADVTYIYLYYLLYC